jgi:hypothetical protein
VGGELLRSNPLEWANKYRSKLATLGVDINDMQSVQLVIADIARNNKNLKSIFDELLLPGRNRQLNKEVGNIAAVSPDAAGIINENDPRAWRDKLAAQWKNVVDLFGEQLVNPLIDNVLKPLAQHLRDLSQWAAANPTIVKNIAEGFVILGAALIGGAGIALIACIGANGWLAAGIIAIGLAAVNWHDKAFGWVKDVDDAMNKISASMKSALQSVVDWIKSFLPSWMHASYQGGGFGGGGGGIINASYGSLNATQSQVRDY